jgi:hypothetical protein
MFITVFTTSRHSDPFPKPGESNPHHQLYFFKMYFNVILPSTPRSPKWSLPTPLCLTNSLAAWSRVLLWKLIVAQEVEILPVCYGDSLPCSR